MENDPEKIKKCGECKDWIPEPPDIKKVTGITPIIGTCIKDGHQIYPVFSNSDCIFPTPISSEDQ